MAHELSYNRAGKVEFFYYGALPWHGLGTSVEQALTSEQALDAAGLNWDVVKRRLYVNGEGDNAVPGYKATVRSDDSRVLGIVGDKFKIIQNREAFSIIDDIVGSKEAIFHTAGAIRDGRRVWALVKLPEQLVVTPEDVVDQYLLLANAHDGSQSLTIKFTPVRVVCNNTLSAALPEWADGSGRKEQDPTVYIRHTENASVRIDEAKRVLGIARKHFEELGEGFKALSAAQLREAEFKGYLENVFPIRLQSRKPSREELNRAEESQKRHHDLVSHLYESGAGARPGTVWGAYNAVTEYVDHVYVARQDGQLKKNGLQSAIFGVGAHTKGRALEEAYSLVS